MLSLIATALATERESHFTLIYANRGASSAMFVEDLADLKDRYPGRLQIVHVFSREPQFAPLLSGRLDRGRMVSLLDSGLFDAHGVDRVVPLRAVRPGRGPS